MRYIDKIVIFLPYLSIATGLLCIAAGDKDFAIYWFLLAIFYKLK